MKSQLSAAATILFLSMIHFQPSTAHAQGSLTPPGAPAATMKTLSQIEPRTPISAATTPGDADSIFKITQPGSYYVTTNIFGQPGLIGIEIAVNGVTLDLMGFELIGVAGSQEGIAVSAISTNICIRNGSVRGWTETGVNLFNARNGQMNDLRVSENGLNGIYVGPGGIIIHCSARTNGNDGISINGSGVIRECVAQNNGGEGIRGGAISGCLAEDNGESGFFIFSGGSAENCSSIGNGGDGFTGGVRSSITGCSASLNTGDGISASISTITDCSATDNFGGGIYAGGGSTVSDCTADNNDADGIATLGSCTVDHCTAYFNGGDGIQVSSNCRLSDNTCTDNGQSGDGAGIHTTSDNNRLDGNNVTRNVQGLNVTFLGNLIIRNSASDNDTNYVIVANNKVGGIVSAPNSMAISGSTGGAGVGSTDPWANFSY
jgi:parallel beta-helix repeat protein